MRKYVRDLLVLGLTAIALDGGCMESAQAAGGDEKPRPKITLRVYDYARVPTPILVSAEGEAEKIFRKAGVDTEWLDCRLSAAEPRTPAFERPFTTSDLILRLLPPSMAQTIAVQNNEVGMALAVDETPATDALTFCQRVLDLARTGYTYEQEILPAAMAHEIARLALDSNTDSATGIMRAKWNRDELELARLGRLLLTPDQSELIRAEPRARLSGPALPPPGLIGADESGIGPRLVAQAVLATKEASSYRLIVRMHNYALVKPTLLSPAKHVAGQVFSAIGIELSWFDVPLTHAELANSTGSLLHPRGAVVDVSILPRSMSALARLPGRTLGSTPMAHEGDRATVASVYCDRIEREACHTSASTAQLLGYTIVHELGHMLLRTSHHASTGIMIAKWRPVDLQRAAQGLLGFTPQQAEDVRAEIGDRGKTQQASPEIASSALLNKPTEVRATGPVVRALRQPALIDTDEGSAIHAEVPFKLYRDFAIVARGSVGQRGGLNFLIDTGSSSSVVDVSLARKLRLVTSPREISVFGTTVVTEEAVLPSLQLGPLQVALLPVVVQDLSYFRDIFSVHVDAIVGIDVLSRSSFTVDYEARKLIWGPVEPLSYRLSCDPRFPYPTVRLEIGDRTLRVFVDTGAKELALFENRTGAIPGSPVVREETRTTLAGPVVVKTVELHELTLGTTHWAQREGSLMKGSLFDGTLGPKWLGAKRISFDAELKVISWEQ